MDFDGLFCLSDNIAFGAIRALTQLGVDVPGAVKVIGFDNSIYSTISSPTITTVDRDLDAMARIACEKLLERMESKDSLGEEEIVIEGKLIQRESC